MKTDLQRETLQQIDALCRKISVAHNLDAEIQEELRGHIEDKVLAYLNGEEAVTPRDAMLLAREHFGDAASIKGMLRGVHSLDASASFGRRLAAIMALFLGVWWVTAILGDLNCVLVLGWSPLMFSIVSFAAKIAALAFTWWVLLRWRRRMANGEQPWFLRWRPLSLFTLVLVLAVWRQFIPLAALNGTMALPPGTDFIGHYVALSMLLSAALWLWWFDSPPRARRAVLVGLASWLVFAGILFGPMFSVFPHATLHVEIATQDWYLSLSPVQLLRHSEASWLAQSTVRHLTQTLAYATVALSVYGAWRFGARLWKSKISMA